MPLPQSDDGLEHLKEERVEEDFCCTACLCDRCDPKKISAAQNVVAAVEIRNVRDRLFGREPDANVSGLADC
jgi:hypothetical protein